MLQAPAACMYQSSQKTAKNFLEDHASGRDPQRHHVQGWGLRYATGNVSKTSGGSVNLERVNSKHTCSSG